LIFATSEFFFAPFFFFAPPFVLLVFFFPAAFAFLLARFFLAIVVTSASPFGIPQPRIACVGAIPTPIQELNACSQTKLAARFRIRPREKKSVHRKQPRIARPFVRNRGQRRSITVNIELESRRYVSQIERAALAKPGEAASADGVSPQASLWL
jgi:hypothetical protein